VASILIPGGRSLRPVKHRGSFDKVVDQNFFPIFTAQSTPLTKFSPQRGKKSKIEGKLESEIGGTRA